eukprot:TRINITY_DN54940_c0_g1_i1.p1 TRINITY_DN54940_c0_g1~~TRINITY_DN54940_c0_g1_i1.p1  ORF type:complete len:282 (-),score=57.72 TRINITY_DN54940_c0_g1_i1:240-1019(-)
MTHLGFRRRASSGRPLLGCLCFAALYCALRHVGFGSLWMDISSDDDNANAFSVVRVPEPSRREALMLSSAAVLTGGASAAEAGILNEEDISVASIFKVDKVEPGYKTYLFNRPAGFKRLVNPLDPSGYVFRNAKDSYLSFATKGELRENATTDFKPEDFIEEDRRKFGNSTGSSFILIKGGGPPDRVDTDLNVKYYEVEYAVRTQLGFSFDSLKTLHFLTVFAVSQNAINILNLQALDEKWEKQSAILRPIADSFRITS